jgi:tetratricopeptide (TPR) repeat protein
MNLEEDILIECFLRDELSETEKNDVLERMDSDVVFRQKILLEKQLFEALDDNSWSFAENIDSKEIKEYESLLRGKEATEIKEIISQANTSYQKKSNKKRFKKYLFSSAAVIALLVSLYTFMQESIHPADLYTSYISSTELPSIINRGNNYNELTKGQLLFEAKDYSEAVKIFSNAIEIDSENASSYIYLAVSQMELNQFTESNNTLDLLIKSNLIDAQKGYWYKSLLYLKSNQIEKSKVTLKTIIDNSYFNTEKAKELLKKVRKL